MNQQNTSTKTPVIVGDKKLALARRVDEIASGAMQLFQEAGSFEAELGVAQAMGELRTALTDEMMQPIMALMNTDLGFRTDRDPSQMDQKTGQPYKPYPVGIVRECFIEARLRGFHAVGNEWNIISGRFYAAKNGLRRKVTTFPGVTDFKDIRDVPRMAGEKGAIVKCKAGWKKNGTPDDLEVEIPIKVNSFMGADAILGKAERKLLKLVHDRMSGIVTPDGEVEDAIEVQATVKPENAGPTFGPKKDAPPANPQNQPTTGQEQPNQSAI